MIMAGFGVAMTGMMAGAAIGSPWGPAVMIGSLCGGMAIMMLAN